jgi:predicted metal-dependent phosphoesterase TrpH
MAVNLDRFPATAQDATALRQVFAALTAESCPHSYNFHMHTVFSDGRLLPEDLMAQAIAIGLKGLAITDHHSVDGYRKAQHWLDQQSGEIPTLWTGVEINSQYPPAAQVIDAVHEAGGLTVLAHPVRYKRSPVELIPAAAGFGIDGIEAFYAYNNPSPWQPSPKETQQVLALGQTDGLLNTCGTDTHGLNLLQRL